MMLLRTLKAAVTDAMTTEGHQADHAVFKMNILRLHHKDRAVLGISFNSRPTQLELLWILIMAD